MTTAKLVLFGIAFIMVIFSNGPLVNLAISSESVEQERTLCLQDCRDKFGYIPFLVRGGGSEGNWRLYFKCIDDCERKFWKEWQKEHDELEDE